MRVDLAALAERIAVERGRGIMALGPNDLDLRLSIAQSLERIADALESKLGALAMYAPNGALWPVRPSEE